MFCTGVSVEGDAVVQRVGSATSEDLIRWRKHPKNPLIEADPRYYEQQDEGAVGCERMWRARGSAGTPGRGSTTRSSPLAPSREQPTVAA